MGDYRQFFSMNKYTAEITPVGERHSVAVDNNFQSMAFAPDGTLYWAHCHPDYEYLDRSAGISDVTADNDAGAAPEYYNLQGIRVADPAPGHIYIVRRGAGVAKVRL